MDQLKVFLKQCVKYRFWIAFGISILLPLVGYIVGYGTINAETTKSEAAIKTASADIGKFKTPGIVNGQYQPLAATKKEALVHDVDATWRKLFESQEPLLKWPPEVQERFRKWGRKYPTDVDRNQVQSTLIDYAVAYPDFVSKIYKVFNPFNFEDGTGIVVAPDPKILLSEATYSQDSPPDLSKIWAEQERLWVVTALLDVVAKVNDSIGAKAWDDAIVKQIMLLEVGAATDQDQKSIAKGETLVPADTLSPDGTTAAAPPPATPAAGGPPGMMEMMMGGGVGAGAAKTNEVLYLKTESPQFKALPIKMVVLVEQSKLPNYLVGLENSPMAIQVNEIEIAKPLSLVVKPVVGDRSSMNMGMMGMMGMGGRGGGDEMMGMMGSGMNMPGGRGRAGVGGPGAPGGNYGEMMSGMMGGGRGGAAAAPTKKGVDNRSTNAAAERLKKQKKEKDANKAKVETKKIDQYFNVIEVTVYGQARFYLAPPAPPQTAPSTAATEPTPPSVPAPAPDAPKAVTPQAPPAAPDATKKDEAPKAEVAAPKADEPKAETPAPKGDTPKPEASPAKP